MAWESEPSFARLVTLGSMYCWITPVLVAALGRSQVLAGVIGIAGIVGLAFAASQLPGVGDLDRLYRDDRWLALGTFLIAVSPLMMLGYAVTGAPLALAAMIVAGTVALIILYVVRGDFQWTED